MGVWKETEAGRLKQEWEEERKELDEKWEKLCEAKSQIERKINIMFLMLGIQLVALYTQLFLILIKVKVL